MCISVLSDHKSDDLRQLVALGCRVLAANGHDDYIWGHVSVRDPGGRGVWMKAATSGFEEITADEVILVSFEGDVVIGEAPRHSEWPIHTEAMLARPDISAVVHSHPSHCVALGASGKPLLPVSHAACMFVPPAVPTFTRTSALITTTSLGADVANGLSGASAMLLVNHGIVTVGRTIPEAVLRAVVLEKAAYHQTLASSLGDVVHWTDDDEALLKREAVWSESQLSALWDYLTRRLPPHHSSQTGTTTCS